MTVIDYEDISFEVRKALEEVYSILGPGLDEEPYKRALAQELTRRGVPYERNKRIPVLYKAATIGEYTLDFVVRDKVYVRIAAEGGHPGLLKTQVVSGLKAARLRLGVLVDMNVQSFKLHEVVNPDFVLGNAAASNAAAESGLSLVAESNAGAENDFNERPSRKRGKGKGSDAFDKLFGA